MVIALLILLIFAVLFPTFLRTLFAIIAICVFAFFLNAQSSSDRIASESMAVSQKFPPATVSDAPAESAPKRPAIHTKATPKEENRAEPDFCNTPTGIVNMKCSDLAAWGLLMERNRTPR